MASRRTTSDLPPVPRLAVLDEPGGRRIADSTRPAPPVSGAEANGRGVRGPNVLPEMTGAEADGRPGGESACTVPAWHVEFADDSAGQVVTRAVSNGHDGLALLSAAPVRSGRGEGV